jgi:hypothetical protein
LQPLEIFEPIAFKDWLSLHCIIHKYRIIAI